MENEKTFQTPVKTLARLQVVHFGKILFNLQFVLLAIMLASVLSFIMPAIYYLMLICLAVLTVFTLLAHQTFISLWSGGETLTRIAEILQQSWRYTIPVLAILSIAAIVCLCFDKTQKHPARITISVLIALCALVVLFSKLTNTGVLA